MSMAVPEIAARDGSRRVCGLPPIARADARVLILGSMPGAASLAAGEYYAHPRNAFWRIVGELLGFAAEAPYAERLDRLRAARIAVWDVLQSCARVGSLDANIERHSEVANDFPAFFGAHRQIALVCFNGGAAEAAFRRHALPRLTPADWRLARLPSTSPANASSSFAGKLAAWRAQPIVPPAG